MGVGRDERDWIERTSITKWENGRLPGRLRRWTFRHPVLTGALVAVVVAAVWAPLILWSGELPNGRGIVSLVMPFLAWWYARATGEVWDRWREANPHATDRVRDELPEDAGLLERWSAHNQVMSETRNEIYQDHQSLEAMMSPLARRWFTVRAAAAGIGLAVVLVLVVVRELLG